MKRIKQERERLGFNQKDFATKLNIVPGTLNNYEAGYRLPNIDMLKSMADIFDCSVDYLIQRTDNRKATLIEYAYEGKNVEIELDDKYYRTLTPDQVQDMLEKLQNAGFDVRKIIDKL